MSALIIAYNTHQLMRNMEEFTDYNKCCSVACVSDVKKTADCQYPQGCSDHFSKFHDFRDIKEKHPLKLYGGITKDMPDLLCELNGYLSYQEFHSVSLNNIYEKIADDVAKLKARTKEIIVADPVFAIIYQEDACFMSDDDSRLTKLLMVYPRYGQDAKRNKDGIKKIKQYFAKNVTKNVKDAKCTVYLLNRNHKLFYNMLRNV